MLSLCRLAMCAADFGRSKTSPQRHSSRSPPTPPPRCARHRPSPPREVGYTRLRHSKSDRSRINPTSIGREGGARGAVVPNDNRHMRLPCEKRGAMSASDGGLDLLADADRSIYEPGRAWRARAKIATGGDHEPAA